MFDSITNEDNGRWYNAEMAKDDYKLINKDKVFEYISKEWESDNTKTIKNVKIRIFFTDEGWDKLNTFLDKS
jgi:hypothetical protein